MRVTSWRKTRWFGFFYRREMGVRLDDFHRLRGDESESICFVRVLGRDTCLGTLTSHVKASFRIYTARPVTLRNRCAVLNDGFCFRVFEDVKVSCICFVPPEQASSPCVLQ